MSLPSPASIPLLKPGITMIPYQDDAGTAAPRFLLTLGGNYFLVSAKARALVLALLRTPADADELEIGFEAESGQHVPAPQLLALVSQTLPPALFLDAPEPARDLPFIVSLTLLGPRFATRVTGYLAWLFSPMLAWPLVGLFAVLHLFTLPVAMHQASIAFSAREGILLACLYMLSGLIHELGHTAACRHFRCPHGGIGFGLYLIFPAWYADVTQAWRLGRRQRAVVDLGGVYFQSLFLIAVDAWALATGNPLALKLVLIITFTMLFTLNPVFKFDGYWLLSDLSGLHNLHQQVRRSTAALIAAVMGKRPTTRATLHGNILYAYSVLSTVYLTYFAYFLVTEIGRLANTLPANLANRWQVLERAAADPGWGSIVAFGQFAGALVWPLIMLVAIFFFTDKLRRSLLEIVRTVNAVRAPSAGAGIALEKI